MKPSSRPASSWSWIQITIGVPPALRGHVFLAKGMYREAISEYEKFAASPHAYDTRALAWLGNARALSGDTRGALKLLERDPDDCETAVRARRPHCTGLRWTR